MKIKVLMKDWLAFHPYKSADEIDNYYLHLTNRILPFLLESPINELLSIDQMKALSIRLIAMFEDIISETEVWHAFVKETESRTGRALPFYDVANYEEGELNVADVQLMIWLFLQQGSAENTIINPLNQSIEQVSEKIYNLLNNEYEKAYINTRMQNTWRQTDVDNYITFRSLVEWFHYNCFVTMTNIEEYDDMADELYKNNLQSGQLHIMLYNLRVALPFSSKNNLWALTSVAWVKKILRLNGKNLPESNCQLRQLQNYKVSSIDDNNVYLTTLSEKETFAVIRFSFQDDALSQIKVGNIILCQLSTYLPDSWFMNGLMVISSADSAHESLEQQLQMERASEAELKQNEEQYQNFVKAYKGKPFVFIKTKRSFESFMKKITLQPLAPNFEYAEELKDGCIASIDPKNGLHLQYGLISSVKADDNPFYNEEEAKKEAFSYLTDSEFCPYPILCYYRDHNLLPDAQLRSANNEEEGKRIVHDNWDFWVAILRNEASEEELTKS